LELHADFLRIFFEKSAQAFGSERYVVDGPLQAYVLRGNEENEKSDQVGRVERSFNFPFIDTDDRRRH